MKNLTKLLLASSAIAFASVSYAEDEVVVKLTDVPAAVQKTLNDHANGGKIAKVEKETKDGKVLYEAKVLNSDKTKDIIHVDETGKLVGIKHKDADVDVPWAKVPPAVQKTITDHAHGIKVDEVEKEVEDGKVDYEAKIDNPDDTEDTIHVDETGKLLRIKHKGD